MGHSRSSGSGVRGGSTRAIGRLPVGSEFSSTRAAENAGISFTNADQIVFLLPTGAREDLGLTFEQLQKYGKYGKDPKTGVLYFFTGGNSYTPELTVMKAVTKAEIRAAIKSSIASGEISNGKGIDLLQYIEGNL